MTHCTSCYKAGLCASGKVHSFSYSFKAHAALQGSALKSCRTSFFVSSALLPGPARCTTWEHPILSSVPFFLRWFFSAVASTLGQSVPPSCIPGSWSLLSVVRGGAGFFLALLPVTTQELLVVKSGDGVGSTKPCLDLTTDKNTGRVCDLDR